MINNTSINAKKGSMKAKRDCATSPRFPNKVRSICGKHGISVSSYLELDGASCANFYGHCRPRPSTAQRIIYSFNKKYGTEYDIEDFFNTDLAPENDAIYSNTYSYRQTPVRNPVLCNFCNLELPVVPEAVHECSWCAVV